MSLNILSKDILLDAQKKSDEIFEQLHKEQCYLEAEYETGLNSFKKNFDEKFKKEYDLESKKLVSLYKKESRHEILNSKKEVISEVRIMFLDKLINLNLKERKELFNLLIKKAKPILKFDKVFCDKKDNKIMSELLPNVKISNLYDTNGLIFESGDGKELLDLSYNSLINEIFENNEDKIQKVLFS